MKRYILYDYDTDKLVTKTIYIDYDDAVDAIGQLNNVDIITFCVEDKEVV